MRSPYRGSCLCGAVQFEIDEFLPHAAHCHCSMCRKFHGAAYATIASAPRPKFRWLAGEDALKGFMAANGTTRTFCRHCGSSLTFASPRAPQDIVEIALGTLDDDVPVTPSAHIFVASRANWAVIDDGLPQYAEGRNSARLDQTQAESSRQIDDKPQAVRQGDIYWLQFEPSATEPGYPHPHVVIQDDTLNQSRIESVVVCALTTNMKRANEPGNVLLDVGEGNLPKQSIVVVGQVSAVDKAQLGEYIGALDARRVEQILAGMRFQQRSFFSR